MITINTADNDKYFELNGITYPKIYQTLKREGNKIAINSIYRSTFQPIAIGDYSEYEINGTTYSNQDDTITAILKVIFIINI